MHFIFVIYLSCLYLKTNHTQEMLDFSYSEKDKINFYPNLGNFL